MTSASCSSSRMRFLASRSSTDSFSVTPGLTPSSTSAFFSQFARQDSEIPKSFALIQRGFVLPGDRDNVAAELGWVGLGHDDIFPAKTNLHRSGVNQTGGNPSLQIACASRTEPSLWYRAADANGADTHPGATPRRCGTTLSGVRSQR